MQSNQETRILFSDGAMGSARNTVVRSPGPHLSQRNLRSKTQTSRPLIKEKENKKRCDTDLEFGIEVDSGFHIDRRRRISWRMELRPMIASSSWFRNDSRGGGERGSIQRGRQRWGAAAALIGGKEREGARDTPSSDRQGLVFLDAIWEIKLKHPDP